MSLAKRAGALVMIAVLVLGLSATIAGAKKKHRKGKAWPSEITLVHPTSSEFNGTVKSGLAACRNQRLVTVFYTEPQTGQTLPLSVQRTDRDGHYAVTLTRPAYAGTYRAVVSEEKVRALKAKQTCKGAQSAALGV